jgi:hypothetical protein
MISLDYVFGPNAAWVTGDWRKLHSEELHNWHCSPNIIRVVKLRGMRWTVHVARMGDKRKTYRVLVRKPELRKGLGRPRLRWEDNIKMGL